MKLHKTREVRNYALDHKITLITPLFYEGGFKGDILVQSFPKESFATWGGHKLFFKTKLFKFAPGDTNSCNSTTST